MTPECAQFVGRLRDLCEGRGLDGRPNPPAYAVREFRAQHGLASLPEAPRSGGPPASPAAPVEIPNVMVRGINFGYALARHLWGGMRYRTPEEIAERFDICAGCEHHVGEGTALNCGKCGCSCNADQTVFLNKLAWKSEKCPEGKWT